MLELDFIHISSLHYVMEACAENNVQLIVLDRPNPNGFYVDGPILDLKFRSFCRNAPCPCCSWNDNWGICKYD